MPKIELTADGLEPVVGSGNYLLKASFESTQVRGAGGFYAAQIQMPMEFEQLWERPEYDVTLCAMSAKLFLGSDAAADRMVARAVENRSHSGRKFQVTLSLPLTAHLVEHVEAFRNGRDLDLFVELHANVFARHTSERRLEAVGSAAGSGQFQIPRSHWVDKVLPQMAYLTKYIIEMSVPSSSALGGSFQRAVKELGDAEKDFRNDNYDGVLVNCRNAADAIASAFKLDLGGEEASYSKRVKAFQEQHLQPRVGSTKGELVADSLLALWRPLSAPAKPGPFSADRPAAKYVLQSTANLLAYLGKVFSD